MYLQNEFLMAAPLAVYVGIRIWTLFVSPRLKALWTVLFLAILAGYPVAETLAHRRAGGWTEPVVFAGYCALPLLLYLIMTVIPVDLAIAALRRAGAAPREAIRSRRFRTWRLAVSLGVPLAVVLFGIINHRVLRVHDYRIEVNRRSSAARELTIVFMADLHFRDLTPDRLLDSLAAKVNAQKPDLILVGGDMLDLERREKTARYERMFRRLVSRYGTFGVPGNHDRDRGGVLDGFLERAGIRLLEDEALPIDEALLLVGRKDRRSERRPVAEILAGARRDLPIVLLSHRPEGFGESRGAGADLMVSGHTHHGQLFPVNILTGRNYDLSWGHLERDGAHLIVTSGVQGWGPPVRTVGSSEIVVIHLIFN